MVSTTGTTYAAKVAKAVESDLKDYVCLAETDVFIENILHAVRIEENFEEIWEKLSGRTNRIYESRKRRWKNFPLEVTTEETLYAPFIQTVNRIQEITAKVVGEPAIPILWHANHDSASNSKTRDGPSIKPEVLAVLKHRSQGCEEEMYETATKKKASSASKARKLKASEELQKGLGDQHTWWHSVVIPVEVEPEPITYSSDIEPLATQLGIYMRLVLQEQVDRRFVLGLTLCGHDLNVWLCDRAGLVVTATPINIHEQPKMFVKVMAALSLLEAHEFGWDTNMRMYSSLKLRPIYSWSPECTVRDYSGSAYDEKWVIRAHLDSDEPEFFIAVRMLNGAWSEVMRGRATQVWLVMVCDANGNVATDMDEPCVLKRCWRPANQAPESSMYRAIGSAAPNTCELYGAGDSKIVVNAGMPGKKEEVDSTDFIRHSIISSTDNFLALSRKRAVPAKPQFWTLDSGIHTTIHDRESPPEPEEAPPHEMPVKNALTRTFGSGRYKALIHYDQVMKGMGWPIKFFKDLPELLRVTRDAITAHRDCYWSKVLHRDISLGNILICPQPISAKGTRRKYDPEKTEGKLIDFDHAIKGTDDEHAAETEVSSKSREKVRMDVTFEYEYGIEDSAVDALVQRLGSRNRGDYVRQILETKPGLLESLKSSSRPLKCEDLDLYDLPDKVKDTPKPIFTPPQSESPVVGTLPFISTKLLSPYIYSSLFGLNEDAVHDAFHDMESFFWAILYLCMTLKGPGGQERDELQSPSRDKRPRAIVLGGDDYPSLNTILYGFFECRDRGTIYRNKDLLLRWPKYFESYFIARFHAYFDDLKDFIREWWRLLWMAYQFPPFSLIHIHEQFIVVVDTAIARVAETEARRVKGIRTRNQRAQSAEAARDREIERRKKDLAAFEELYPNDKHDRPKTLKRKRRDQPSLDESPGHPCSLGSLKQPDDTSAEPPIIQGDSSVLQVQVAPRQAAGPLCSRPPPSGKPFKKARTDKHKAIERVMPSEKASNTEARGSK